MGLDRGRQIGAETNAEGGKLCAEEIHPDDGRVTYDDPKRHKGKWGRHLDPKHLESKEESASMHAHP